LIKGIIFDLGSTLIRFTGDWPTLNRTSAEAMADWYLKKKHIKLNSEALVEAFLSGQSAGQELARTTQTEALTVDILKEALQQIDAPAPAFAGIILEAAVKIYYEPIEPAWQIYPEAVDTLKALAPQYRLGLYSNAPDDAHVQRMVNRTKLRPWLSPVFSSAGWGWRKPMREPFEMIAAKWGLQPAEIVMVGDSLDADIQGATHAGMRSILVTMDEPTYNDDNRHIHPTATAGSLAALPAIVAGL
jgi:putative hydrolase of the HAD superfamily